jgi:hypothetical protein
MSNVDHPDHYGGKDNPYEAIKVVEAWGLDFCLGNAAKYISRAGQKDPTKEVEDLEKASWYIRRRIRQLNGEEEQIDREDSALEILDRIVDGAYEPRQVMPMLRTAIANLRGGSSRG